MSLINDKDKLERIDQLIRLSATGTPEKLAKKLNTSKSTIQRTIKDLKEIGCPIYYNRSRISYCYRYEGKLVISFETLNNSALDKIIRWFFSKNSLNVK